MLENRRASYNPAFIRKIALLEDMLFETLCGSVINVIKIREQPYVCILFTVTTITLTLNAYRFALYISRLNFFLCRDRRHLNEQIASKIL